MPGRDWMKSKIALKVTWGAAGDVLTSVPAYDSAGEPIINGEGEAQIDTINAAGSVDISLPNTFTANTGQEFSKIHGFGYSEFNAGVVRKIPTYRFSLRIPAVSSSARIFRALMVARRPFKLDIMDANGEDMVYESFRLIYEIFDACYVTDMDTGYEIADVPAISINGIALRYNFKFLTGEDGVITDMGVDIGHIFGNDNLSDSSAESLFEDIWSG